MEGKGKGMKLGGSVAANAVNTSLSGEAYVAASSAVVLVGGGVDAGGGAAEEAGVPAESEAATAVDGILGDVDTPLPAAGGFVASHMIRVPCAKTRDRIAASGFGFEGGFDGERVGDVSSDGGRSGEGGRGGRGGRSSPDPLASHGAVGPGVFAGARVASHSGRVLSHVGTVASPTPDGDTGVVGWSGRGGGGLHDIVHRDDLFLEVPGAGPADGKTELGFCG